jgi:hypothetical protein
VSAEDGLARFSIAGNKKTFPRGAADAETNKETEMKSTLHLSDLQRPMDGASKLMNVKIPDATAAGVDQIAAELHCTKTAAVIALLNEGLDAFAARRGEFPPSPTTKRRRRGRPPKAGRRGSA